MFSEVIKIDMGVKFWTLSLLALSACCVVSSEKRVICYYGTWATYRPGNGKFDVENINPYLCTHIVYAFVGINDQGNVMSLDSSLDLPDNGGADNFGKFNALKQQNPKLKTLLAVGGWDEGSRNYSIVAAYPNLRKNFIDSALDMVLTHGFDGFDVDWEYPNRRDSVYGEADIDNFTQLIKELKEVFEQHGLMVTAAVASVGEMAALSYDVASICKYLDVVGLMTYDFYGAWDNVTGHNAALHKGEGDENAAQEELYTVDYAVEYWLEKGCPPDTLVIGLPFYGRTFTLTDANTNGVRAPASGAGIAGPFTDAAGSVGYNEFCDMLQKQSWDVRYDQLAEVPYAVQGKNWVSYDDANSLTKKIEWGLQKNITGIMLWSIETDDFHGICGENYPLLRAINKALGRSIDENEDNDGTESAVTETATTEARSTEEVETTETENEEENSSTSASTREPVTEQTNTAAPKETTTWTDAPETESTIDADIDEGTESAVTETATTEARSTKEVETTETENEKENSSTSATTSEPVTEPTNTAAPIVASAKIDFSVCSKEGIRANPYCTIFSMCIRNSKGQLYAVSFSCPETLFFDARNLYCNFATLVSCNL